ncbi:Hypothetical predicted protein [Olea europaea subsp. europaea]|uniref:Uncharacterized protein n=1 Tax=Olea europaea subsp. europaea TaxID=158383 RepID=A0A8S0Q4S7_OLEEU|nr:Hypothetical predicted protein [Olea europaea subsp. europaea]
MVTWEILKRLASVVIDNVLELKEAEHDDELHHAFYQHSRRASQPPTVSHELNIMDLLRTKIEKLEGMLQAVITTQLDQVERKVDGFVELAIAGLFHSATSAFDGATSYTAYVLEAELKGGLKKNAGFDGCVCN